jgi:protein-S-isoprenylcysteine O-methyltransferase Ste14
MFATIKKDWYFLIPAFLVGASALAVTGWNFLLHQKAVYRFEVVNLVGVSFLLLGLTLRVLARKALGKHFSYALRIINDHTLVKHGIYRYIRHPAYLGYLLFYFGVTLLFSSWYGFLIMLLLIPCFLYRISIEEEMLVGRLGAEYQAYKKVSKKMIPYLY